MKGRAGYSLLEVLIALAIMAMVLSVLIPGQAHLLRRASTSGEGLLATDLAASRLARLGIEDPLTPGHRDFLYRDWRVIEEITEAPALEGILPVYAVSVEILSGSGTRLALLQGIRPAE
jgi:prepilin-type N-terminal cleavage/methylation domain-containing protein